MAYVTESFSSLSIRAIFYEYIFGQQLYDIERINYIPHLRYLGRINKYSFTAYTDIPYVPIEL